MKVILLFLTFIILYSCNPEDATLTNVSGSNFIASQVCTGQTDGVITGTTTCNSGIASSLGTAADVLSGTQFWNASGVIVTGTMNNRGSVPLTQTFPGVGYYAGVNYLPIAADICYGSTFLGVKGSRLCGVVSSSSHPTGMMRDVGSNQFTMSFEKSLNDSLPSGYRVVPDIVKDTDGYDSATTTAVKATRPSVECGTAASMAGGGIDRDEPSKIAERIEDCYYRNPTTSSWDGMANGISSETHWKLVTRSSGGKEVWADMATGLLWSDEISAGMNWCYASGSSDASGVAAGYRENDPNNYCDSATYQDQTNPYSACAEFTGAQPTLAGENYTAAAEVYGEEKGGMGKASSASSPSVIWRLPTLNDYLLANINGLRFVLQPNSNVFYWTATVQSNSRNKAWRYKESYGVTTTGNRRNDSSVRCVGFANW